jgi:hypothetical protein
VNSKAPIEDARKLWTHIYGDSEGYMAICSAVRTLDENGVPIKSGEDATRDFEQKFFRYPQEMDKALSYVLRTNKKPLHEVWCAKNLFKTRQRADSNVVGVGALAVELDGPSLPNGDLTPTAVVRSSPAHLNADGKDHFHPYLALTHPIHWEQAKDLNKRLGKATGGEKTELSGLLRIPGTINWKHPEKPTVELLYVNDSGRFGWEKLDDDLPGAEKRTTQGDGGDGLPPVRLTGRALEVWQGKHPKYTDTGDVDRSATLCAIARVLTNGNLQGEALRDALEERDLALGLEKFSDRGDADRRYWDLVDLVTSGPQGNDDPTTGDNAGGDGQAKKGRRIVSVKAANVEPTRIAWLWEGWLARGKFGLWDGNPGVGKSLATTAITSTLTQGGCLPGGTEVAPMNVLICNVEDGLDDTIVPRLTTEGADLSRVHLLRETYDEHDNPTLLQFPRDLDLLEAEIIKNDVSVVFLDPIATMLEGDITRDQEAKKCLTPLAGVADRTGVAMIGIRHFVKGATDKGINKGGGSLGAIGVARMGANFEYHPDDVNLTPDERRIVMAQSKTNISRHIPSLVFKKVTTGLFRDEVRVEWLGTCNFDADALARASANAGKMEKPELINATQMIKDILSAGPVPSVEVHDLLDEADITRHYKNEAKKLLKVQVVKASDGKWFWVLHQHFGRFDKENPTVLKEEAVQSAGGDDEESDW